MTVTRRSLDTNYVPNGSATSGTLAKQGILKLFSEEPDDLHNWTEQDIYEQSQKIIARWDNA